MNIRSKILPKGEVKLKPVFVKIISMLKLFPGRCDVNREGIYLRPSLQRGKCSGDDTFVKVALVLKRLLSKQVSRSIFASHSISL